MSNEISNPSEGGISRRTLFKGVGAAAAAGLAPSLATGTASGGSTAGTVLGTTLNGRPRRLSNNLDLVEASNTTWVRAFFDIREKLHNGIHPKNDPDVVALREAVEEQDCRLVVSLKWDFAGSEWLDKDPIRVPEPGSDRETEFHRCATRYLRNVGVPVDVVVLGNEPMWETLDEDIDVENPPVVRFMRRAKDHLVRHGDHGDASYLIGAFNQIGRNTGPRHEYFNAAMLEWARGDDEIDGLDVHVHYGDFSKAEQMVSDARRALPDGTIAVTEFSPVWRYDRHVDDPIGDSSAGAAFCAEYGYDTGMTAVEYFERAKDDLRPQQEVADFYEAMPWYNTDHVARVHELFAAYGVRVGCLGFLQGPGMREEDWTSDWSPFHINFLFQQALMEGRGDHHHYLEDYRRVTTPGGSLSADVDPVPFDAGTVALEEYWREFAVDTDYENPVVLAPSLSYVGPDPAHVRVNATSAGGFEARVEEWGYLNDRHYEERAGFLMFEAGSHASDGGRRIEAGRTLVDHEWTGVSFDGQFESPPAVFTAVQSTSGPQPVVARTRNVSPSGFEYRLQEEEANDDVHRKEATAWLAVERGQGTLAGRRYEAGHRARDADWRRIEFARSYENPTFVADVASFAGHNPVGVRYRNLTADGVEVFVEEERSDDGETWHLEETVSYFVVEG